MDKRDVAGKMLARSSGAVPEIQGETGRIADGRAGGSARSAIVGAAQARLKLCTTNLVFEIFCPGCRMKEGPLQ
ncbi:hypothetical protein GCM10027521_47320 [Amycolatopsis cihanbeyliensis]